MTLPNFLVIGAAKSGTDALCAYLDQHPDVFISAIREPNFFVAEGQPCIPYRGPGDRDAYQALGQWVWNLNDYAVLFANRAERALGEGTAHYLYFPSAAHSIKAHIPDARLIAILRHPADRAYSAYNMLYGDGREHLADFSEALAAEAQRARCGYEPLYRYVDMGFYARQLRVYNQLFRSDQLRVVLYDDFLKSPDGMLRDLFGFLGVDPDFEPDTRERHNVSLVPRHYALHRVIAGNYPLKRFLKEVLPVALRRRLKYRAGRRNMRRPPPLDPVIRARLMEIFRADMLELQDLLDRDLSGWLAV
jgi:hypothetical protein